MAQDLTPEQEAQAQELLRTLQNSTDTELLQIARLNGLPERAQVWFM